MTQTQTNGKAITKSKAEGLKELLTALKPNMEAVLPKHLTAERMIKVVMTAALKTPDLYQCSRESLMQSVMLASQLGLDCGGVLGSAYLIPYKRNKKEGGSWVYSHHECQLIIGYRGMIDLARRSGQIESISARAVFEGDVFQREFGLADMLRHVPESEPEANKLTHVYCVARFKDGGHHVEVMTRKEVDAIRSRSKAKDDGPWVTDYVEMAKKTVIRRAFKYFPMSVEMQSALSEMQDTEVGREVLGDIIDTTATEINETPATTDKAAQVLNAIQQARGGDETPVNAGNRSGSVAEPANVGTVDRPARRAPRGSQHSAADLLNGTAGTGNNDEFSLEEPSGGGA